MNSSCTKFITTEKILMLLSIYPFPNNANMYVGSVFWSVCWLFERL